MKCLLQASRFLDRARQKLRHGEFSREEIKLLRLQWTDEIVECDWLMRPLDPWDRGLPSHVASQNQTRQALSDAMSLRNMIFKAFRKSSHADLRMFRLTEFGQLELMISGKVARENEVYQRVPSVAMRARLCGFHFSLAEGVLERRNLSQKSPL